MSLDTTEKETICSFKSESMLNQKYWSFMIRFTVKLRQDKDWHLCVELFQKEKNNFKRGICDVKHQRNICWCI